MSRIDQEAVYWFGQNWGDSLCLESTHIPAPVGTPCYRCGKPIETDDRGVAFLVTLRWGNDPRYFDDTQRVAVHIECYRALERESREGFTTLLSPEFFRSD